MKGWSIVKNGLTWFVVAVALAFFLLPVVWILITSFKAQGNPNVPLILDVLERNDIRATFFVPGTVGAENGSSPASI